MGALPSPGIASGDRAPALQLQVQPSLLSCWNQENVVVWLVLTRGFPFGIENIFASFLQSFYFLLPNTIWLMGY